MYSHEDLLKSDYIPCAGGGGGARGPNLKVDLMNWIIKVCMQNSHLYFIISYSISKLFDRIKVHEGDDVEFHRNTCRFN